MIQICLNCGKVYCGNKICSNTHCVACASTKLIEVDEEFGAFIYELNKMGYRTKWSCAGHFYEGFISIYLTMASETSNLSKFADRYFKRFDTNEDGSFPPGISEVFSYTIEKNGDYTFYSPTLHRGLFVNDYNYSRNITQYRLEFMRKVMNVVNESEQETNEVKSTPWGEEL